MYVARTNLQVAPLIIGSDRVSSVAVKASMESILPRLTDLEPLNLVSGEW